MADTVSDPPLFRIIPLFHLIFYYKKYTFLFFKQLLVVNIYLYSASNVNLVNVALSQMSSVLTYLSLLFQCHNLHRTTHPDRHSLTPYRSPHSTP